MFLGAIALLPSPAIADSVQLSVLMGGYAIPIWQPVFEAFTASHPDIEIKLIEGPTAPNQLEDLYAASFLLGDSPYDLVYLDITWVAKFAAAGWLRDLDPWIEDQGKHQGKHQGKSTSTLDPQQFLAGDWAGSLYKGHPYRIPAERSGASLLYYRQDLLAAAGLEPPQTPADLVAIAQQLQRDQQVRWGYLFQGKQYEGTAAMFTELLAGFGGFWVDPQTHAVGLDQPEGDRHGSMAAPSDRFWDHAHGGHDLRRGRNPTDFSGRRCGVYAQLALCLALG